MSREKVRKDIEETVHYLKVLQKYDTPFQPEIRHAISTAIAILTMIPEQGDQK